MDVAYGARYRELYRSHWWWRAREEYLLRVLRACVDPSEAGSVLDFGCGDGLFFSGLSEFGEPFGIELDERLLDPGGPWRARIDTRPVRPDPAEWGRFGLVVALDVLEHIDAPEPVVEELVRRLRPGGWFVATVPAFDALWTTHDDLNEHVRRYRRSDIERLARSAGLRVTRSNYFFGWVAIPKWILSRLERIRRPATRPPRVPPGLVNATALNLCRLEQRVQRVLPLPFGSSVLLMGQRPEEDEAPSAPP
jgi:SAM-dependent methyltransferase